MQRGNGFYSTGNYGTACGWQHNPYFGMFTYLPCNGVYNSPFGYRFWSPNTIQQVYERPTNSWGGGSQCLQSQPTLQQ